jgi:hypothetical protein
MEGYGTPLMFSVCHADATNVRMVIRGQHGVRACINRTDTKLGVTPLIATGMRPDFDEAVKIARILLENGADINGQDSGPGAFPLFQAAQEGNTALVQLFLQSGADLMLSPRRNPTTTALWIACQDGHVACAVEILKAAEQQGLLKRLLEQPNSSGITPCCLGVERGHGQVVGVLVKVGCDVRRTSPAYYCPKEGRMFDPEPAHSGSILSKQYPLDMAVRSHATLSCANCGTQSPDLKRCGKCNLAYFCNRECQMKHFPYHKRCCSKLASGRNMYGDPSPAAPFPEPLSEPWGFQDGFWDSDWKYTSYKGNYDRNDHAVWEYDAGPRGRPDWRRYPDALEASLESLLDLGAPKYMYKPGDPDAEGMYERTRTKHPPAHIATRHVSFDGLLTEREVYTGASRSVRRNGKRLLRNGADDDGGNFWPD